MFPSWFSLHSAFYPHCSRESGKIILREYIFYRAFYLFMQLIMSDILLVVQFSKPLSIVILAISGKLDITRRFLNNLSIYIYPTIY